VARDVEVRLQALGERLAMHAEDMLSRKGEALERHEQSLRELSAATLQQHSARLEMLAGVAAANDPKRILAHGFSIVRVGGKALTSIDNATCGETAEVTLADGTMNVTITDIWKKR
jgi:exonuclease VII large subunit